MMKLRNILITLILCLSSCVNPLQEEQDKTESEALDAGKLGAPTDNIPGSVITGHEIIVLTFNETVTTATFSGTLTDGVTVKEVWTDDNGYINDTVHLHLYSSYTPPALPSVAPAEFWPEGAGRTLIIDATGESGKVLSGHTKTYEVFNGSCVDDSVDSGGNGTVVNPFKKIQDGIDRADLWYSGATLVRVAEGSGASYQSNYNTSGDPVIDMINSVSVYGGYNNSFSIWNPVTYVTRIEDTSSAGTDNRAVDIPSSIGSSTILSGFTIKLGEGHGNRGISCNGSPQIENNIIVGCLTEPTSTCYTQIGIYISGASTNPEITNNNIDPGFNYSGDISTSCAIECVGGSGPEIHDNVIDGGSGFWTYGIILNNTGSISIENNVIDTGYADLGITDYAYAIHITGCSPTIRNNELTSSTGAASKYGIYEYNTASDPAEVRGNDFNFTSEFWYWDEGTTSVGKSNYTDPVSTGEGTESLFESTGWDNKSTIEGINI